ncbi:hypothetical protein R1flu_015385 [Riccia fluitans]|uniref:Uncharacterized protein n=1 Tax=Riccia fluitans TaxID=41844 RepID=A0ABD1YLY9_9MARC
MDPLTIFGLVETLGLLMGGIVTRAKDVYYLKDRCKKFADKIDEIQQTLKDAKSGGYVKDRKVSPVAAERFHKLKINLGCAEGLLIDLQNPMKMAAVVTGEASKKLDELEKDILDSVNLLNFHSLFGASSSTAAHDQV